MSDPSVCAICITANREEMTRQAVTSFTDQTYPKKRLLVYDTSEVCPEVYPVFDAANVLYFHAGTRSLTIGALRNEAIEFAQMAVCPGQFDIIVTFDSDDRSHPNRIAEQVQLLQSSGADVVGYREMLFWRDGQESCNKQPLLSPDGKSVSCECGLKPGEAWLYQNPNPNYALGTSLCYWRHVWERKPFEATSIGEDERFLRGLKVLGVRSIGPYRMHMGNDQDGDARMICRIHAGNTSTAYSPRKMEAEARKKDGMWKRVPEWDAYCAETMK